VTHLGDRACLLVDGELDADAHDDAMAHLASCGQCRRQVTAYRHLKAWLAQTPTDPGPALMARLLPIPERHPVLCPLTSASSPSRSRARSVAAAGFAASVVVGLGAAATGSSVAAGSGGASLSGPSTVTSVPIGVTLSRPGNPAAVSVVYRRP
jgi:anti-sigma factor RsiW